METIPPRAGDVIFVRSLKPIETFQKLFRDAERADLTHAAILADDFTVMEAQFGKGADFIFLSDWKRNRKEDTSAFTVLRNKQSSDAKSRERIRDSCIYFDKAAYAATEVLLNRPTPESRAVCSGLVAKILSRAGLCDLTAMLEAGEPTPSILYDRLIECGFEAVDTSSYWNFDGKVFSRHQDFLRQTSQVIFTLGRGNRQLQTLINEIEASVASILESSTENVEQLTSDYHVVTAFYSSILTHAEMSGLVFIGQLFSLAKEYSLPVELLEVKHFSEKAAIAERKDHADASVASIVRLRTGVVENTTECIKEEIAKNLKIQEKVAACVRSRQLRDLESALDSLLRVYSHSSHLLLLLTGETVSISDLPDASVVMKAQFQPLSFIGEEHLAAHLEEANAIKELFDQVNILQISLQMSGALLASTHGREVIVKLNQRIADACKGLPAAVS